VCVHAEVTGGGVGLLQQGLITYKMCVCWRVMLPACCRVWFLRVFSRLGFKLDFGILTVVHDSVLFVGMVWCSCGVGGGVGVNTYCLGKLDAQCFHLTCTDMGQVGCYAWVACCALGFITFMSGQNG